MWPPCNAVISCRRVWPKDYGTATVSLLPYIEVTICKRKRWHVGPCDDGSSGAPS